MTQAFKDDPHDGRSVTAITEAPSLSDALRTFEAVAVRQTPPDPEVLRAIGLNHNLESAVADLVDNAIDADATEVLVRFVLRDGLVHQVLVVDNGSGMSAEEIDAAMKLGGQRSRRSDALGHFGVGLKAASLSQASLLTVLSRQQGGVGVGRRLAREPKGEGFAVEELKQSQVEQALDLTWNRFTTASGTIVLWDELRTVPKARDPAVTNEFVNLKVTNLRHHLGLVFHRLLERGRTAVTIDVLDAESDEAGLPFDVSPIDPFAYVRTGVTGFPKRLLASYGEGELPLECHIWPGGSDSHCFKLAGRPIDGLQGFYVYRHGRLLSIGGWAGVAQETKRRRLARVAIDVEDHESVFAMSMEKAGVRMTADLVRAIEMAVASDGTSFSRYLHEAEQEFTRSNMRFAQRAKMLPPGQGIAPPVKRAIAQEVDFADGEDPLTIRWTRLTGDAFVEVDRRTRTLWLNTRFREAVLKGARGGLNDAPLIKALLYLLYEDIFRGTALGAKDKDNMIFWGEILNAAAEVELRESFE